MEVDVGVKEKTDTNLQSPGDKPNNGFDSSGLLIEKSDSPENSGY